MSDNEAVRRQLGGMPTGHYDMADMQFSVREVKPEQPREEPSTVSEYELWNGSITVCAKHPFRELEEAVERWIKREGLE